MAGELLNIPSVVSPPLLLHQRATLSPTSNPIRFFDHHHTTKRVFLKTCYRDGHWFSPDRRVRVFCQSKSEELQVRKFSPLLESSLLSSDSALVSDKLKAVPDIWRHSADKYGDRVAVVDPYHDPPSTMTYKEVVYGISNVCLTLRIILHAGYNFLG